MSDEPVTLVDARGLRCPLPVIRLAAAARDHVPGDLLTVWSTDPAARHDVPAWARMRGHTVVESTVVEETAEPGGQSTPDGGTTWAVTVRLGA
ncbi:sulfurtransferase TusA family protein [Oerskovia sp. NPDC057915]|uniref:sulfurtransferase TusA family protein n=1 Tax=Oerskovia sp. NPDC057915 TaxID=3346280 RepID=UPI0036DCE589